MAKRKTTISIDTLYFLSDELAAETFIGSDEMRDGIPVPQIVQRLRERGFPVETCPPEEWGTLVDFYRVPDCALTAAETMSEELREMMGAAK